MCPLGRTGRPVSAKHIDVHMPVAEHYLLFLTAVVEYGKPNWTNELQVGDCVMKTCLVFLLTFFKGGWRVGWRTWMRGDRAR